MKLNFHCWSSVFLCVFKIKRFNAIYYTNIPAQYPKIPTANSPNIIATALTFFFNNFMHKNVNNNGNTAGNKESN